MSYSPVIARALQIIDENYAQGLKISSLATDLGVSYHHLCRKFKKEVGETIGEHVAKLRIERAKGLLRESSYSVGEISLRCGYRSTVQFHRMFERLAGDTPMQYRKKAFSV